MTQPILVIEKQRQAWNAVMRGMDPQDVAAQLGISYTQVRQYLREEEKRLGEQLAADSVNLDSRRAHYRAKLDIVISSCYKEMTHADGPQKPSYVNAITRAIELQMKLEGLLVQRIEGADGGPVKIMAVTDRQAAVEELVGHISAMKRLYDPDNQLRIENNNGTVEIQLQENQQAQ